MYIDAGTADGVRTGATWQATIDGRATMVHVIAAASHDAVLDLAGAKLAVGAVIDLPPGTAPPPPVTLAPPPIAMPPWQPQPAAAKEIQIAATHEQPGVAPEAEHVRVSGELALSAYLAGDTDKREIYAEPSNSRHVMLLLILCPLLVRLLSGEARDTVVVGMSSG